MRHVARLVLLIAYDQYDRNGGHVLEVVRNSIEDRIRDDRDEDFVAVEVEDEDSHYADVPVVVEGSVGWGNDLDIYLADDWAKQLVAPFMARRAEEP